MPYLNWKGEKIFYLEGAPENWQQTILCLHGAGGNYRHWAQQLAVATDWGYRVLAIDLPGHGKSGGFPLPSIEAYSHFVIELVELLGLKKFILAGHSMGSAIALELALSNRGDIPKGLILIGASAKFKVGNWLLESLSKGSMPPTFIKLAYSDNASSILINQAQNEASNVPVAVYLNDFTACKAFNVSHKLSELRIPCFLISGIDDRLTPVKDAKFLAEGLPYSQLELVPEAGHMVMIEKSHEVNHLIKKFLRSQLGPKNE